VKKMLLSVMVVGAAVFGMFAFEVGTAAPAEAHNRVCRVVSVPPTLPWYKCLQNVGGTSGTGNSPAGCYTTKKTVCS
jgi:hypothetical protein